MCSEVRSSQSAGLSEPVGSCPLAGGTGGGNVRNQPSTIYPSLVLSIHHLMDFAALKAVYNIIHLNLLSGTSVSGMGANSCRTLTSAA